MGPRSVVILEAVNLSQRHQQTGSLPFLIAEESASLASSEE